MKKQELTIKCPQCGNVFDLDSILVHQFQESIKADLQNELSRRELELQQQREDHRKLTEQFKQEQSDFDSLVDEKVKTQVKTREDALKESIRKQIQEEKEAQLEELENELRRKSAQLIELNQTKAKLQRLSREFEEKEAKIHLQMEEKLNERLAEMKTNIKEQIQIESFAKVKEKEDIISSLERKLQEATQRIQGGSTRDQGEGMELAIDEMIRNATGDETVEIGKGQRGGDIIQKVITSTGEAGTILYEVKNTQTWSDSFLSKLRSDNLSSKCDLMVIISKTRPKQMGDQRFMLIENIWVTTPAFAADLAVLLSFGLKKVHAQKQLQQNGDQKAHLLYSYLTSQPCQELFNSMMDGLKNLQDMNQEEERKLQALFRKRETQLQQILSNLITYYGTAKGIADESILDHPLLEFKKAS